MTFRTVSQVVTGGNTVDGAGVKLVRVLGPATVTDFDPFLMLDAFDSKNPDDYTRGFPMHPHRGIETVTYLIQGLIEHQDSLGNKGVIRDGCYQWMTAGRGILHQEMPKTAPRMLGLQLWVNLPKKQKMTEPAYRDITDAMIPMVEEESARVRVLSGEYKGQAGGMKAEYVDARFLDVEMPAGASWTLETRTEDTLFAYILEGSCAFEPGKDTLAAKHAVLFTQGDALECTAGSMGARMVLVSGAPIREPVAWGGPIVMNTREELAQARKELNEGTFIR